MSVRYASKAGHANPFRYRKVVVGHGYDLDYSRPYEFR